MSDECKCMDCSSFRTFGCTFTADAELRVQNKQLQHDLALTRRALELACDDVVTQDCFGEEGCIYFNNHFPKSAEPNDYLSKARDEVQDD